MHLQIIYDDDFDRADIFDNSPIVSLKFNELKENSKTFSNANIDENSTVTKGMSDLGLVLYTSGNFRSLDKNRISEL
jgi:hypothetical protein